MVNEMNEENKNIGSNLEHTKYTREYMKCTKSSPKEPLLKLECIMVA